MKRCNICGKKKLISSFFKNKYRKSGYQGHCKKCSNDARTRWRQTHKRRNKVLNRLYQRKWWLSHKEIQIARSKENYRRQKEEHVGY